MMSPPTVEQLAPPTRHGYRRTLTGLAIVVGLTIAGAYAYLATQASRRLRDALAEADRLDPGWRLGDLEQRRAYVAQAGNSGETITRARALLPPPNLWPPSELDDNAWSLQPCERLRPEQLQELKQQVVGASAGLDAATTIADLPQGRFDIPWTRDFVNTPLAHVDAISIVTRFLGFDLLVRIEEGDSAGSLRLVQAQFNCARAIGDEPCAISQMVRLARGRQAMQGLERLLAQLPVTPAALQDWQRQFEEEDRERFALRALRSERAMAEALFQSIQDGHTPASAMQFLFAQSGGGWHGKVPPNHYYLMRFPGALMNNRAALLRFANDAVELAKLAEADQVAAMGALESRLTKEPTVVQLLGPAFVSCLRASQQSHASLRCGIALVALEQYRLKHGKWPESLAALTPDFLPRVPIDPTDGQALCYRRLPDGVVVYALGKNGKDDGGQVARKRLNGDTEDLGFRLWDVEHRRKAAPAGSN